MDISPRILEIARGKENPDNVRYAVRDVHDLSPASDGLFDAVFAMNAVFSMGPIDEVLAHFRSVVAPGGTVVIIDVTRPDGDDARPDEARRSFEPFEIAHTIYTMSGDADAAIAAIRYMLHPTWQEMNARHIPPTRSEFKHAVESAFPGADMTFDIVPSLAGVVWHAPKIDEHA